MGHDLIGLRMPLGRFGRLSIREKLLAMALLPLLVAMCLLAIVLLGWGNAAFDRVLLAKVRSDLAVARGYFDRVLAEVGTETAAVAESHALHVALSSRLPLDVQRLLRQARSRAGLDFVNLLAPDGTVLVSDHGLPAGRPEGTRTRPETEPAARAASNESRHVTASIEVLTPDAFATVAPALQSRVAVPIVSVDPLVRKQAPPEEREERAMVALATAPVHSLDGRVRGFVQGGVLLNRNLAFIDHINQIVYPEGSLPFGSHGTATLFLGDVRISTNVRLFRNERAIGTRVSPAVRDAVLERGQTWLQRAFVVDDWYVSGYQPLHDRGGQRIGMLHVGLLEQPFTRLKIGMLGGIAAIFLAVMAAAALASLRWARGIFQPLEQMTRTMHRVETGAMEARVGPVNGDVEIGRLARHLDHLLDTVDDKTRAMAHWNAALDAKVVERTQALEASHASLQSARQRFVRAEKLAAVGQLTAGIAHELNNPIAVVQGNLDLVRELLGTDVVKVKPELHLVDEQLERMRMLMTQFLQFARPSEYAAYVENIDPARALEESLVLVRHLPASKRIEVVRDFKSAGTAGINRQELQQVLVNLLENAIHAMPDGGTLSLGTRDRDEGGVEIVVMDSGPGLGEDLIPEVFDAFVTRRTKGTGLGLWMSKFIVERYGGDIHAADRSDGVSGAVFTVQLPGEPDPAPASA